MDASKRQGAPEERGADAPEPELRRVLAPNPSPMTYRGTNTWILGEGEVAVIDPGPAREDHLAAILAALRPGERVGAILVTHSHLDHSPLARPLAGATGAPVLAAGPSDWGRSAAMEALARSGGAGGGEGVDRDFAPDARIAEGDVLEGGWGRIEVLATPGHMANHLSFGWRGALFVGDTVMGWSTSLVSPPDGDMTAFMATLDRLAARADRVHYPGHGDPVADPAARVAELIAHRRAREAQIRDALKRSGPATAEDLARAIYTDLDPVLLPAATRNVLAHLLDLNERNLAGTEDPLTVSARFALT
ncbi:MBL fold metallo-hydrolase [Roseicyclus sp.]|uniref:MBL fold metallo-hydrolase n=1 Tax=Roseicyclus sp. TaxID=1914329 RepID=UPI003F9F7DB1